MASPDQEFFVGQGVTIALAVADEDGDAADSASTLTVVHEDGVTEIEASLTHDGVGQYSATVVWTQAGLWYLVGAATDPIAAVTEDSVYVRDTHAAVA